MINCRKQSGACFVGHPVGWIKVRLAIKITGSRIIRPILKHEQNSVSFQRKPKSILENSVELKPNHVNEILLQTNDMT